MKKINDTFVVILCRQNKLYPNKLYPNKLYPNKLYPSL